MQFLLSNHSTTYWVIPHTLVMLGLLTVFFYGIASGTLKVIEYLPWEVPVELYFVKWSPEKLTFFLKKNKITLLQKLGIYYFK